MAKRPRFKLGGVTVPAGASRQIRVKISERYTGDPISLPVHVVRAKRDGPTVFVSAAIHGDELNGMGVIHDLIFGEPIDLTHGTLILVPVVNIFGLEVQSRYMPDRRDLNRSFPGSAKGSLTSRVARVFFDEVINKCDYGIDLHTAAGGRTNFPNVRGDLTNRSVRRIAKAFGVELMVNGKGPDGSLRREAVRAGCPTIILEAGEPLKIEPGVLAIGLRGVRNVLRELGMTPGKVEVPSYQMRIDKSVWVRAEVGGILRFHVAPGTFVEEGQAVATNAGIFGETQNQLLAPSDGIVLGMTTLPTVKPGEPVCHLALPTRSLRSLRKALKDGKPNTLYHQVRKDLATNVSVSEQEVDATTPPPAEDA
ncbi:MAG: succinylglutamate desuccinylase/aspartoacylase family protein [Phycisphaeraceae bacterium]